MRAETIIYTLLSNSTGLAALVGQNINLDTRAEDAPLPAIVYGLISDKQDNAVPGGAEMCTARIQVNVFSQSSENAVAIREQVRLACHNQSGTVGGYTLIDCIQDVAGADSYEELIDTHCKPIDFILHYLR